MINYTVVSGDTMWQIASKHGIGLNDLLKANPQITNPVLIFSGQNITVPSAPGTSNDIRALESEVIRLVNVERARAGSASFC